MYFICFMLLSIGLFGDGCRLFHTVVGAGQKSSTSRNNKFSTKIVASLMSISRFEDRLPDRGGNMTSDTVVLDVSRDWATACDVQERFMQHAGPRVDTLSYSAHCRQVRAVGGDFYDFMPLPHNRLALAMETLPAKGSPPR
jgi:hypothetical protein